MTHALKTHPEYYKDVENGRKEFEIRKDDRPFELGDDIILQEYSTAYGYTGKEITFRISYILRNAPEFGLKKGYCILGLKKNEEY